RAEPVAGPLELAPELRVVVDLAVLHDVDLAVLVRDRLVAAGEVDDREPPGREPHAVAEEGAVGVGSAVDERRAHRLEPRAVDGVLPPLLYSAAFFTSLRDLRANVRQISLLAIGLVFATVVAVAAVAHAAISGLGWGPAFVLGAVVAPTDPIAATAIAGRLGVPRRVVTIVEGESLIN